jgi:metal iron transporter
VGIIGATVMPHSLFLGSALATQDRIQFRKRHSEINQSDVSQGCEDAMVETRSTKSQSLFLRILKSCKESVFSLFRSPPPSLYASSATRHNEHSNNSYEFVRAHIYHGTFDMVGSLLGFAVVINSLCVNFVFYLIHYRY